MSYKARVVSAAQEILKCRVKDISGPKTKIMALPLEHYAKLRKELKIEVLSVIQAGVPEEYVKLRLKLPSQNGIPMDLNAPKKRAAAEPVAPPQPAITEDDKPPAPAPKPAPVVAAAPAPVVAADEIPEPPVQNKQRLPGEESGAFHARRMHEGKAYKKWEREYGEAYAGARSSESVPPGKAAGNGSTGETEAVSFDPDGAPGPTPAGQEFDPIKEQIEVASMEALLNKNA